MYTFTILMLLSSLSLAADDSCIEDFSTCQQDDYIALRALYLSTDGDNWTDNTGWPNTAYFNVNPTLPTSIDMSTWYGIGLDANGCVNCIDMDGDFNCFANGNNGNNLSGSIPPELGNLVNLTYLNLYNNQLSGSIPPEFGNFINLQYLLLHNNNLSGSIPSEFGSLNNLAVLYLYNNNLSGNIPLELGSLSNLTYLNLYNNQLSGNIPPQLGNLVNLTFLSFASNQLSGNIPSELSNLVNLAVLVFNSNQFNGSIPPELGNLTNLTYLSFANNQLNGNIPSELGNLTSLTDLYLFDNQLSGCYDDNLSSLCNQLSTSSNTDISSGNNFDAPWEDFCNSGAGECNNTQTIPSNRICDWSKAGLLSGFCHPQMMINIMDHYTDATGQASYDMAVQSAISQANGNGAIISFPPGTYQFNSSINLESGIVLKGSGANSTQFVADLNGANSFIIAEGAGNNPSTPLANDAPIFQDFIEVSDGTLFQAGDYVKLDFDDDHLLHNTSWGTVGQIVLVESKVGNRLNLYSPLRRTYTVADNTSARKFDMIEKVGVECLSIERVDATSTQTNNILFKYTTDSWVHAIESDLCNFAHITIEASAFCKVSASYMHHAHGYGGGGKAYGVAIQRGSSDIKIEDNIFEYLRHSILLQSGANGSVIAYNYSFDPYQDLTGDLVCHGNYPYLNLFESNIHHFGIIDDSHGLNGPNNTYFRNRAMSQWGFGIYSSASEGQNIVGYEIIEYNGIWPNYYGTRNIDFQHGNQIEEGNAVPRIEAAGTGFLPDVSYYFTDTDKPAFLSGYDLPMIGFPNGFGTGSIPAKDRHANGQTVGGCLPNCPPNLVLNQVDIPSGNYFANQTIFCNGTIEVGANVTFCAGDIVELGAAFESEAAQNFKILTTGCPNP